MTRKAKETEKEGKPAVKSQTPLPKWAHEATKAPETEGPKAEDGPPSDAHNMNWADAQACMARGQKVRRNGWGDGSYLFMNGDDEGIKIDRPGGVWPYVVQAWDAEAEDWQVAE